MKSCYGKVISRFIILIAMALLLLVNVANASVNVVLALPAAVNLGEPFNITITVTNNTTSTINFNKVAVGYLLQDLKIRGPYEVATSQHSVPANQFITFTVPFKVLWGSGVVVPLMVVLAQNSYDKNSIVGGGAGGVKVN
jgi:hypothetical protein